MAQPCLVEGDPGSGPDRGDGNVDAERQVGRAGGTLAQDRAIPVDQPRAAAGAAAIDP